MWHMILFAFLTIRVAGVVFLRQNQNLKVFVSCLMKIHALEIHLSLWKSPCIERTSQQSINSLVQKSFLHSC